MKRSQIVEILKTEINAIQGCDVDYAQADFVLKQLENAVLTDTSENNRNIIERNKLIDELRDECEEPSFKGVF